MLLVADGLTNRPPPPGRRFAREERAVLAMTKQVGQQHGRASVPG
jgi:hypothetical protein